MATDFIAVDTLRSYDSEKATENIKAGEPIVRQANDGGARLLDPSSDTDVEYLAGYERDGDHIEEYQHDFTSYSDLYTYKPASNKPDEDFDDRVPTLPIVDKDVVRCLTVEDTSVTEPTFAKNDVVGFIAATNGPRLVPEGYTADFNGDGTNTTYSEANGNFVPIGEVDIRDPHKSFKTGYNEYIPVRVEE